MLKSNQDKNLCRAGDKGLIKTVLVIVIALIVLGYFGFNVGDIINSPTVQANLHTAWSFVLMVWNNYLAAPVIYIWSTFFVGVLWKLLLASLGVK